MEQAEVDNRFNKIVGPYRYWADVTAASYDQRMVNLANRMIKGNYHVDYDQIWQVADEYKLTREDVLDHACNLAMVHSIETDNAFYQQIGIEDYHV